MRHHSIYFVRTILFWLILYFLVRLAFLGYNYGAAADTTGAKLWLAFFYGFRLDLSLTSYVAVLSALIIGCMFFAKPVQLRRVLLWFNMVWLVPVLTISIVDIELYHNWNQHLDGSALLMLKNPEGVTQSLSLFKMVTIVLLWLGSIYAGYRILRDWVFGSRIKSYKLKMLPVWIFVAGVMFIPARGGVGRAPINTGVAFFSDKLFANHTAVNATWNFAYSLKRLKQTTRAYRFMAEPEAKVLFDSLMHESGVFPKILNTPKPNVVVILLESFSAQAIEMLGGTKGVTPNLTQLKSESIVFSNIMAASDRSGKGMVAVFAGYPVQPSFSIIQYPQKTASLSFLPMELKKAGYNDLMFMYGGDINFNNFNSFVHLAGYDKIISQGDFPSRTYGVKWGSHDEYTLDSMVVEMKHSKQPFCKGIFTLSSHEPFDVPGPRFFDDKYLNSVHYTDACLGRFFKKVKAEGLWDNTLFVLVADHGVPGPLNATNDKTERFHIPIIFTGGALAVKDTVVTKFGTQTDVARTVLCQLGLETQGFRFSKNLLDTASQSFAFYDFPDGFGLVTPHMFQVYDNDLNKFIRFDGAATKTDSLLGKAYLQSMYEDYRLR